MPSPTYAQLSHGPSSSLHRLSPPFAPLEHSLQREMFLSPTLSHDLPHNHADASDTEGTPPTSSLGLSSQEKPIFQGQGCSDPASGIVNQCALYAPVSGASAESPKPARSFLEAAAAPKRTSSGQIKRSSIVGADFGENRHDGTGHSRNPSLLSSGSSVTEVGLPRASWFPVLIR